MRQNSKILLRKLTIGLTPVLMGTLMMAMPKQAKADTVPPTEQEVPAQKQEAPVPEKTAQPQKAEQPAAKPQSDGFTPKPQTETHDVTRTIIVVDPRDNSQHPYTQTVTFTRTNTVTRPDGSVLTGQWDGGTNNGQWDEFNAPAIPNYEPYTKTIAAKKVTPDTPDDFEAISYYYHPWTKTESKDITRTIVVVNPDNSQHRTVQTVTFTRTDTWTTRSDSFVPGPWLNPTNGGKWDAFNAPKFNGWKLVESGSVAETTVTPDMKNVDIVISYLPIQNTKPEQPTKPLEPTKPAQPTKAEEPTTPAQPTTPTEPTEPVSPTVLQEPTQPTQASQATQASKPQPTTPAKQGKGTATKSGKPSIKQTAKRASNVPVKHEQRKLAIKVGLVKAKAPQKVQVNREQGKQAHTAVKQSATVNHVGKAKLPSTGTKQDLWTVIGLAETVVALLFGKAWKREK